MADNLTQFLESKVPDLIHEYMVTNFYPERMRDYDLVFDTLIRYIRDEASKEIITPDSKLGRLDFAFELQRRISKKYNFKEPEVYGNELPSPLPHWPKVKIYGEEMGITHDLVEKALAELWTKHPQLVFETAESIRRSLLGSEIQFEMYRFLESFFRRGDREPKMNLVSILQGNINWILAEMMTLPVKKDRK